MQSVCKDTGIPRHYVIENTHAAETYYIILYLQRIVSVHCLCDLDLYNPQFVTYVMNHYDMFHLRRPEYYMVLTFC